MGTIRVGIGGWTFPPWRGLFYPPGLPHAREFDHAVASFGAIEINATFYGRQKPASWAKWGAAVPPGFRFAIKGSRYVATRPKLAEAGDGVPQFLDQGLVALGDALGPILWLFSERRVFDYDDWARFIDLLPERLGDRPLRHALDVRHQSFADDRFFELARARNVAVVTSESDDFPLLDVQTADFRYARLQRMEDEVETGYDDQALDQWAGQARGWAEQGDAYVFLINGAKRRAPAAALALQARLGLGKAAP